MGGFFCVSGRHSYLRLTCICICICIYIYRAPIEQLDRLQQPPDEDITASPWRIMSSTDVLANGHSHFDTYTIDHVLRPRARKPLHAQVSQVSQVSRTSSTEGDQLLSLPSDNGVGSATTR